MKFILKICLILSMFSLWTSAQEVPLEGNFSITMENDMLGNTDRHYTHGTRLMWTYSSSNSFLSTPLFPGKEIDFGISLAQYMYTPSDITTEEKIIGDRPYAGWMYFGFMASMREGSSADFLELDLGVTGDAALTEEAQKIVHEWTGSAEPMGWENQIDGTLGLGFTYARKYKWKTDWTDLVMRGGGTIGNIYLNGGIGTQFRFGYNIPDDFGFLKMEPSTRRRSYWRLYGILDAECRYVFHNFQFTDEIEREYEITHEPLVSELSFGFGASYDLINITYLYNIRSREFKEQEEHNEFGTICISFDL